MGSERRPTRFAFDVFLSHSSKDKPVVRRVAEKLRDDGIRVWFDEWEVNPGELVSQRLDDGLDQSKLLVLFVSANSLGTDWVTLEHQTAVFRDPANRTRRFVTVRIDDTPIRDSLKRYRYLDYRAGSEAQYATILDTVREYTLDQRLWYLQDRDRNLGFVGRDAELQAIQASLATVGTAIVTQAIALTGLGGIGKTQTAIEHAFRNEVRYRFVFLIHADDPTKIENDYLAIAAELGLDQHEADPALRVRAVIQWLERVRGWLLIMDNVEKPEDVSPFLPRKTGGHIVVTSRRPRLDDLRLGLRAPVALGRWMREESREFLCRETGRTSALGAEEAAALDKIVQAMDGLPLACSQAAVFMRQVHMSFGEYQREFDRRRTELFAKPAAQLRDYPESVVTTWRMNFDQVTAIAARSTNAPDAAATELLLASSFLSPDNIPMQLLIDGAQELGPRAAMALGGPSTTPARVREVLRLLHDFSLIELKLDAPFYNMHRLVQEVVRKCWMSPELRGEWARKVIRALDRATGILSANYGNWPDRLAGQRHANFVSSIVLDEWKWEEFQFDEAAEMLTKTGFLLTQVQRCEDAAKLLVRALEIRNAVCDESDPKLADTLNYLADNLVESHNSQAAIPYYERALRMRIKALGPDAADVGHVHNNVGIALFNLHRYDDARKHYAEARRIWTLLGDDNLVGTIEFNLGQISDNEGEDTAAKKHFRAAWSRISTNHMKTIVGKVLGTFLLARGCDREAVEPLQGAVEASGRAFGELSAHRIEHIDRLDPVYAKLSMKKERRELQRLRERIVRRRASASDDPAREG